MARGDSFTARVEQIISGGAGITRLDGKSVFIELTAPGDTIRGKILKEHKNWAEAELLEILEPSPARIEPACPLYGQCGGCSLQHMTYTAQLEAKAAILRDSFIRLGGNNPPEIKVCGSKPFEYRNRVQFHKTEKGIGFMERKSSHIVPLTDCPIADPGIRNALKERKMKAPEKNRFTVYSRGNTFLVEGVNNRGSVSISGTELKMDASVFFQSNGAMLELLIDDLLKVVRANTSGNTSGTGNDMGLADIYCGVGTFASFLGKEFSSVDLVEENKAALAIARENVRANNVNCYAITDTEWVKIRKDKSWGFMVLDPPREGLSGPIRKWLASSGPRLVAYVSCDPATLARDSRFLLEGSYKLKELTLYDFYPQTAHIESLAIFERENS